MRSRLRAIGRWGGLWGGLLLVLGAVNLQVLQKQRVLDDGRTVLLALRPVDPRPLIQGDYMVQRYAEALVPQVDAAPAVDGRIVNALDELGRAAWRERGGR